MTTVIEKNINKKIQLKHSHFVAKGGEGQVYVIDNKAYKIYSDSSKVIPEEKIIELFPLTSDPFIFSPINLLLNPKNKPIGYSMPSLPNYDFLCKIFINGYCQRNNVTPQKILNLVRDMQKRIQFIHKKNILIVDLNELNFLIDEKYEHILFIDVNSYQTENHPATAIMPCIADPHNNIFSELTDWYSFAIVSFKMFIGIHPYDGRHPDFSFKVSEREEQRLARMKSNVPLWNKDVTYCSSRCRPIDVIPKTYKQWYKAILEEGKRLPPPFDIVEVISIEESAKEYKGTDNFNITELIELKNEIVDYTSCNGYHFIYTTQTLYYDKKEYKKEIFKSNKNSQIAVSPKTGQLIEGWIENNKFLMKIISEKENIESNIDAENFTTYDNRFYIKNNHIVSEIEFIEIGKTIHATMKQVSTVLPKATGTYDGTIIQNVLGTHIALIFSSKGICHQVKLKELDDHKIIDAKYLNRILIVISHYQNRYIKNIFKINKKFSDYKYRIINNIQDNSINMTVLDNGICLHINDLRKLEVFTNMMSCEQMTLVNDKILLDNIRLYKNCNQALFSIEKKLYKFHMKNNP